MNSRMDTGGRDLLGVEQTWPAATVFRSTFVMGAAQFRPWESKGFSLKAGMGMAFVRNWVYDITGQGGGPPYTSKALGLTYGAGWTFRHTQRLGVQIFGAQHVASLGDLETSVQKLRERRGQLLVGRCHFGDSISCDPFVPLIRSANANRHPHFGS